MTTKSSISKPEELVSSNQIIFALNCKSSIAMKPYIEQIGWLGFVLIVSAYLFVTIKLVAISSATYHLMNLLGALCMVVNARHNKAKPLFWLNIVWSLIAIMGLLQLIEY